MPPKRPPPPQELFTDRKSKGNTVIPQELSLGRKRDTRMQDAMDRFADELNKLSDDEENIEGRWSKLTVVNASVFMNQYLQLSRSYIFLNLF